MAAGGDTTEVEEEYAAMDWAIAVGPGGMGHRIEHKSPVGPGRGWDEIPGETDIYSQYAVKEENNC